MAKVKILSEALINKIAAGEVVERPASVVKELVENAIDAEADQIFVTIKNGGKDYISVLDNGCGMSSEDAQLAIERHATSKIEKHDDLERITTMGFRGEALAAISAVSRFELTSCPDEKVGGFQVRVEGGTVAHAAKIGFPRGTRITVENLFFNTPARQKFMKSAATEYNHIHDLIIRLALGHPEIQFRLTHNKTIVLNMAKGQDLRQRVENCFGSEIAADLIECSHEESYLSFHGLISPPSKSRSSKRWQHTFVNDRYVKCNTINHGILEAYKTLLMKHMHPMFFIKVRMRPEELDVNVHPAKTEIRVRNPVLIHTIFSDQLSRLLKEKSRSQFFGGTEQKEPEVKNTEKKEPALPPGTSRLSSSANTTESPLFVGVNEQLQFAPPENAKNEFFKKMKRRTKESYEREIPAHTAASEELMEEHKPATSEEEQDPFLFAKSEEKAVSGEQSHLKEEYASYQVIGQLRKKYILAQGDSGLILVDQHAAHERIRFEEIRKAFYSQSITTHPLMIPIMIELPPQDGLLLEQHQESWEKLGFVIDHFGGNDYSIKEIPSLMKEADVSQVIRDVLDEMAQFGKSGKLEEFFNEVFERMACHSAIRAAQTLSMEEMQSLLNQLASINLQLYCPHGRPVLIEISIDELDKRFRRVL